MVNILCCLEYSMGSRVAAAFEIAYILTESTVCFRREDDQILLYHKHAQLRAPVSVRIGHFS